MVSIVGQSTYTHPLMFVFEKKCFYINGRWWAWYNDTSARFGYKSSPDGIDWTGVFTLYYASLQYFDLWYDEANNKICLVRCASTANIYYRQGTAESNGQITWDSNEVPIVAHVGIGISLCKDSAGYPWIGYRNSATNNVNVVKATATNGSAWGTPTTLWTQAGRIVDITPLTANKMLAISSVSATVLASRLYDGTVPYDPAHWAASVNATTSGISTEWMFDTVPDGDNVHLGFNRTANYNIIYVKYTYGAGWGAEETVDTATINMHHPCLTFKSTDKVRVFYFKSATIINYRDRDIGVWQDAVTISATESAMTSMSSSYKPFSSKFGVLWKSGAVTYDVKFEGYTLTIVKEVTDSLSLNDLLLRNFTMIASELTGLSDHINWWRLLQRSEILALIATRLSFSSSLREEFLNMIGLSTSSFSKFVEQILMLVEVPVFSEKLFKYETILFASQRILKSGILQSEAIQVLGMIKEKWFKKKRIEPDLTIREGTG